MAEHYCTLHKTDFFKTDNMPMFGHPIKENGKTLRWCNEAAPEVAKLSPQPDNKLLPEHQAIINKEIKDPTRTSIERQTSLNRASDLYIALIQAGAIAPPINVLTLAANIVTLGKVYESFLDTGVVIENK